MGTTLVETTEL